ncbi:RNA cap guanine-N2 methyltransferase [Lasiodiplodia theobromae]|uniref:RNA methylase family n=1 Tax=Lasiodiplodia theobromae TaxID=45133 RepID=UPI0015C40999|nr:RNA methylase family [Lasiodiplodia theobromae]KAF4533996.1 RNA methylase family [Lasiodiplodia theobromae]KAF9638283.1 RNA cap guanine-N2 methyltransferase [Lasiodiplodia theobromae]
MSGVGAFLKAFDLETPEQRAAAASAAEIHQAATSSSTLSSRQDTQTLDAEKQKIHHYDEFDQVPGNIQKYWDQRYDIWYKYDEGVWMTDDAWFGVTPEPVACRIAEQVASAAPASKTAIIDAFAGAGGNAIAFARSGRWERIFAFEKDPDVLKCAKHNAEVYGVANKIWWVEGDCFEIMKKRFPSFDESMVVFASPPWGGPTYRGDNVFSLKTMQPYNLNKLYKSFTKVAKEVVLYLPRTSDLNQLAKYVPEGQKIQVAHYCVWGASKALCAFYGDFGVLS